MANGLIGQAHLGQSTPKLSHWRDCRIGARHFTERVIAQIEPTTVQPRPWNSVGCQVLCPPVGPKASTIKDTIFDINRSDQLALNIAPMLPQKCERRDIDWHPGKFHCSSSGHVTAADQ